MKQVSLGAWLVLAIPILTGTSEVVAHERTCGRDLQQRNVIYRHGDVDLSGEWITPTGMDRFPGVVILQGSGSSDRNNSWAAGIARTLARCGAGVLLTDKRGAGMSGGDWRTASMSDLANDGVGSLAWVGRQKGVDRDRLGFVGLSQGGRVAAQAVALSQEADFIVGLVGTSGVMWDGMVASLDLAYRQHGLTQTQIDYLQTFANASFRYVKTGAGWGEYLRLYREIAAGPLALATYTWPDYSSHWYWTFWRKNHAHDARPFWRRAVMERRLSALAIYGEHDRNADPKDSASLREAVPDPRLRIEVMPGLGHALSGKDGALHPRVIELILETIDRSKNSSGGSASLNYPVTPGGGDSGLVGPAAPAPGTWAPGLD